jgi:hypothetical protein
VASARRPKALADGSENFARYPAACCGELHCERGEAKFWLEPTIELAQNFGVAARQIRIANTLIEEHYDEIRNAWQKHFGC